MLPHIKSGILRVVLRVSRCSYHYCQDHPDEWAAFAANYVGIDRATMKPAIARESPGLHSDCKPDIHGLQEAIELQRRLGTVKGDMHSIGKDIVAVLMEAHGFEVHNLGANLEHQVFVDKA